MTKGNVEAILKRERFKQEDVVLEADDEKIELCEALLQFMEDDTDKVEVEEE